MKRSRVITVIVVAVILVAVVAGFAFSLNRRAKATAEAEEARVTPVQNVLMRDLERSYPPTAKEVVRYFADITSCFYNEEYTDEELVQMAEKIQGIYDDELIANKSQEDYLNDLWRLPPLTIRSLLPSP